MIGVLGKVLSIKQREKTVKTYQNLTEVQPNFNIGAFVKAFIYNLLNLAIIGPVTYLVVFFLDGHFFADNMAFGIFGCRTQSRTLTGYKLADTAAWLGFWFVTGCLIFAHTRNI
jgi:hypothetical protein